MERPIVRISAYVAFGFAVFLIALLATFPDDRLREIATVQIESQLGNEYQVDIGDLDLWWLTGVELEDVTITERVVEEERAEGGDEEGDDEEGEEDQEEEEAEAASNEPMQLEVRRIAAGFAPLGSLFNLSPTVDFLVDLGGGAIKGSYAHGSKARTVEVDIKDIELAKVPAFDSVLGVPVLGTLGGEAEVELHPKRPVLTDGRIQLSGRELTVDETTIENRDFGAAAFIDIPSTSFGKLDADLVVEEGGGSPSLVFEEFRFHEGRDVRGEVWGDVSLAQSAAASRADLKMRFQFDDAYVSDNDLSSVLQAKWFRDGKADQWYGFTLKGPMARVDFNGDPSAGAGPKGDDDKSGKGDGPKRPDRDKRRPNRPKPPE